MADTDMMECECGYSCRRDELLWERTQKTKYNCPPEDDWEDLYETICPECGEMESFEVIEAEDPDGEVKT